LRVLFFSYGAVSYREEVASGLIDEGKEANCLKRRPFAGKRKERKGLSLWW